MSNVIHGVVHGKNIELKEEIGLADGQEVELTLRLVSPQSNWGQGILRCAGGMAPIWTEEDDQILEEIQRDRKRSTHREIPE